MSTAPKIEFLFHCLLLLLLLLLNSSDAFFNNGFIPRPPQLGPKAAAQDKKKSKPNAPAEKPSFRKQQQQKQIPRPPVPPPKQQTSPPRPTMFKVPEIPNPIAPSAWNSVTSSMLSLATNLAPKEWRELPDQAARIKINSLPPYSIKIDVTDIPIIGKALSGTYAKVDDLKGSKPSVLIASPKDKLGALEQASETGNLLFGLEGILSTIVDLRLKPNMPGEATVELKSRLIPKLPFAQKRSPWNEVRNLGDGQVYYYNEKTGEVKTEDPTTTTST